MINDLQTYTQDTMQNLPVAPKAKIYNKEKIH